MFKIITVNTEAEYGAASVLFKEYAAWLNIDLSFQKFEEELLQLKEMYSEPTGAIFLLQQANKFIGCVAIRKKENADHQSCDHPYLNNSRNKLERTSCFYAAHIQPGQSGN